METEITGNVVNNGPSQLRRMVMHKSMGKWAAAVLLTFAMVGWSASAQAATITFGAVTGAGGTLSYDGEGGAMVGSGIGLDTIIGGATPSNAGVILVCGGCELSFTTGANTGLEGPPFWTFGGNTVGSFVVTGTVPGVGIVSSQTLLTGSISFASASVAGQLTGTVLGPDVKHPAIVAFYGLTGFDFNYANTDIVITPTVGANGSFTGTVDNAQITNTATVNLPDGGSTMALLGLTLVGLGTLRRKFLI